ncbi:MAG: cysteine--tRNA ligase [Candidatus Terrybacteria bacterium]|nr:cysteine--tRNA ligase [Candidatus Terrybacteria bacterium]
MDLKFYNTLSKKKEFFKPIKRGKVGLYTCGPTVYNFAHIGNLRAYVFADILARMLKYNFGDKKIKWVMNITDVDDKTIRDSKIRYPITKPKQALVKLTKEYEKFFWQDVKKMNITKPNAIPHAADNKYIKKMQALVKKIHEKGFAYIKNGSVYFDIAKYNRKYKYGQLVKLDLSKLKSGNRIDADEYAKENIQDFVLWKNRKPTEPFWNFRLAGKDIPGRPGWHIECSAMGEAELGMPFDIHTGGEDLKFPHHEDEIAQSTIGFNAKKPVNFWIHNAMLLVESRKMSKSLGNVYTLRDIEKKNNNPIAFRYLCLQTHYRKPLDFSWKSLESAERGLNGLYNQIRILRIKSASWRKELRIENRKFKDKFLKAINDDLNIPRALAVVQELLKSRLITDDSKLATILDFDKVLGLKLKEALKKEKIPQKIIDLAEKREELRKIQQWQEADKLREKIKKLGYEIKDAEKGYLIFRSVGERD